jgi:hypothetical protein
VISPSFPRESIEPALVTLECFLLCRRSAKSDGDDGEVVINERCARKDYVGGIDAGVNNAAILEAELLLENERRLRALSAVSPACF